MTQTQNLVLLHVEDLDQTVRKTGWGSILESDTPIDAHGFPSARFSGCAIVPYFKGVHER